MLFVSAYVHWFSHKMLALHDGHASIQACLPSWLHESNFMYLQGYPRKLFASVVYICHTACGTEACMYLPACGHARMHSRTAVWTFRHARREGLRANAGVIRSLRKDTHECLWLCLHKKRQCDATDVEKMLQVNNRLSRLAGIKGVLWRLCTTSTSSSSSPLAAGSSSTWVFRLG